MEIIQYFRNIEYLTKEKKKIIKIESIICLKPPSIFFVDLEYNGGKIWIYCCRVITWTHSFSFCLWYYGLYSTRIEFFLINILFFHDVFHYFDTIIRIIYDKIFAITKTIDKHPEKKRCCWVKCSYYRQTMFAKRIYSVRIESKLCRDSSSHLFCCFIGKSYTEYRSWFYSFCIYHRNNTFCDRMRFSWSSASIDENSTIDCFDSNELLRIELCHIWCVFCRTKCSEKFEKSEQKSIIYLFRFPIGHIAIFCLHFRFFLIY